MPGVRQGEGAQVLHELPKVQGLLVHGGQGFRGEGEGPVQDGLEVPADHGKRGAQFMGHIGQKLLARGLRALQGLGHAVEGLRELADLVAGGHGHAVPKVPFGDALGGVDEALEGQGKLGGKNGAQKEGHGEGHGPAQRAARRTEARNSCSKGSGPQDRWGPASPPVSLRPRRGSRSAGPVPAGLRPRPYSAPKGPARRNPPRSPRGPRGCTGP